MAVYGDSLRLSRRTFAIPHSTPRQTRRDAQENRAHILEVAGRAFAAGGVEVSMDAIARQAGVGSATLYRHYPNKDSLLVALLAPYHARLDHERARIDTGGSPASQKLEQWIDVLGDWMMAYDGLPEPLRAAWSATDSPLRSTCDALVVTTNRFLHAAQEDGTARPGLSGQDIFLGALAIAWASGRTTAHGDTRNSLRNVLRDGWAAGR